MSKVLLWILVILVIYASWKIVLSEGFSSRMEKAQTISSWFKDGGQSYSEYRKDIPNSDIVEYSHGKDLQTKYGSVEPEKLANRLI